MQSAGKIEFSGANGQTLAARLDLPDGPVRAWALFAHCFSCSKDIHAAQRIARRLASQGIAVLRFDFTGLGHSEGDFANTNFTTNVQDLVAAAGWLSETHGGPDLLIGHSLGGSAVIVAAHEIESVKAVVTIGAPADAEHVINTFCQHLDEIETKGEAEVTLAGRPFRIRQQFVEDVRGAKVIDAANGLRRALLVMHSPVDAQVGVENASDLFVAAKHPKSFVSLDNADHLLSREADAFYAADVIAAWSARYVTASAAKQEDAEAASHGQVIVRETGHGPFENRITIGRHRMLADEPASVGGADNGPDPYGLVTAGLGACTSMTLRMYAQRKGWPLDQVCVTLRHTKDHAEDCRDCEQGRKIDIFEREITIFGDLDQDQRERLLEIADKCPVHRTLEDKVHIRTRLADAPAASS